MHPTNLCDWKSENNLPKYRQAFWFSNRNHPVDDSDCDEQTYALQNLKQEYSMWVPKKNPDWKYISGLFEQYQTYSVIFTDDLDSCILVLDVMVYYLKYWLSILIATILLIKSKC